MSESFLTFLWIFWLFRSNYFFEIACTWYVSLTVYYSLWKGLHRKFLQSSNQDGCFVEIFFKRRIEAEQLDQYQYLGNCPPAPPLTQQQSIDNKLGLMLG